MDEFARQAIGRNGLNIGMVLANCNGEISASATINFAEVENAPLSTRGSCGGAARARSLARGVIENKQSTDVEYTAPPPRGLLRTSTRTTLNLLVILRGGY